MSPPSIDLNADLGEGFGRWSLGDDEQLLAVISSANIACGFHAGDPSIMRRVCVQAVQRGLGIGAQVGYRDLAGFGRRKMDVDPEDLTADVLYQLGALQAFAVAAGGRVAYLKPHGALYNTAVTDPVQAVAIVEAVAAFDRSMPILTLPDSVLAVQARARGLVAIGEAFADRNYLPDGSLVPRSDPRAVLHDPQLIADRAVLLAARAEIGSICVHGDTPGAVAIAHAVRAALSEAGNTLAPFVA